MKSFFKQFHKYTLERNTTLHHQSKHGSMDKDLNQQHKGDNFTRIMIVRDPFERLLSGYIDKFFLPSPIFWKKRGKYIIKQFRPNSSVKEQACGHNVTFLEFMQYVVHVTSREKNMEEPHFTPMHTHCKPCLIRYDYVWKLETIMQDFKHTIEHLIYMKDLHIDGFNFRMDKEHLSSDVISRIAFMFERRYDIEKCITFYEACLRTWRGFQMRGVIDKIHNFPLLSLPEDFNVTMYKDLVLKSSNSIEYNSKVRSQKEEAFLESYSLLPLELLDRLERSVTNIDCEMFNYRQSLKILLQDYKRDNFSYFDFL
ncbi:carbohydrate sulfotransferase 9-like [Mytilus californianus]|uniref:carbohydrate sulfotransferase 9-like n=1 Tax=Mytilus californianus TaxID=6549 RepID=UPI0022457C9E|nr:carbohydrate sulfotransferase 9-like [Mytilus californianus]